MRVCVYLERYNAEVGRLIDTALDGWSADELQQLGAGLNRLNDGLDRALGGLPVPA